MKRILKRLTDLFHDWDLSPREEEEFEGLVEWLYRTTYRLLQRRWTAWPVRELLVVCGECGRVGVVTPEDADTWARMRCQCGALVRLPEPPAISRRIAEWMSVAGR